MAYQLDEANEIRGKDLIGETVVLSEHDCHGLIDCTFSSGTLQLSQSKGAASILRTIVKDSDVVAVKRQRNYRFYRARFIGCRFQGIFSGVDFGCADDTEFFGDFGGVNGCDFADATLDSCRFFNVDVSTLRFPSWPHAVLLNPRERLMESLAFKWPGLLGKYMALEEPESVKAVVMHVPSLALLVQCTEEEIKAAFENFGGLQIQPS